MTETDLLAALLPGLMTYQQAAEQLDNLTRQRIEQLASTGELKRIRLGDHRAFITRLSLNEYRDRRAYREAIGPQKPRRIPNKDKRETVMTLMALGLFTPQETQRLYKALNRKPYWRAYYMALHFPECLDQSP